MAEKYTSKYVFPKTTNLLLPILVLLIVGGATYVPIVGALGASPENTDVGYQPIQPVPYSHALHVGQLGLDCTYCHTTVDKAAFAAIPPTQTCMNCHTNVRQASEKLQPVRDSWATGKSIEWVKVHDLPDFAYFNHSAHVNKGVSCVECHSRVDRMGEEGVHQAKNLSMAWCLDCHRNPTGVLRPRDQVTNLGWKIGDLAAAEPGTESELIFNELKTVNKTDVITQEMLGSFLKDRYKIRDHNFMTSCSTCHR
ncbi:MAG: cytochrome c3 family protein [Burkholderiales bacterium]|nr:cytochrome c3 family protein [Phycisphaerae bacterium]